MCWFSQYKERRAAKTELDRMFSVLSSAKNTVFGNKENQAATEYDAQVDSHKRAYEEKI